MSLKHDPGGLVTLEPDVVNQIYLKLNSVEGNVGEVRASIGNLKTMLEHMDGDFDRLEGMLGDLEKILYGKGDHTAIGFLSRLQLLETAEKKREQMMLAIWVAIIGLVAEGIWRFIVSH